jgi:serine/threonine-protein kinase HipA
LNVSIANPDDQEEMALSLDGKKNRIKKENFEHFGTTIGLNSKQIKLAFNRIIDFQNKTHAWIDKSFLSNKMKELYKSLMDERFSRLSY